MDLLWPHHREPGLPGRPRSAAARLRRRDREVHVQDHLNASAVLHLRPHCCCPREQTRPLVLPPRRTRENLAERQAVSASQPALQEQRMFSEIDR